MVDELSEPRAQVFARRQEAIPEHCHALSMTVIAGFDDVVEHRSVVQGRALRLREELAFVHRHARMVEGFERCVELRLGRVKPVQRGRVGRQQVATADRDHLLGGELSLVGVRQVAGVRRQDLLTPGRGVARKPGKADRGQSRDDGDQAEPRGGAPDKPRSSQQ